MYQINITSNDFENICRFCFSTEQLKSIFEYPEIASTFKYITNIKIKENDELPKNICTSCTHTIENIASFLEICKNNDAILKAIIFQENDKNLALLEPVLNDTTSHNKPVEEIVVQVEGEGIVNDDVIIIIEEAERNPEEIKPAVNSNDKKEEILLANGKIFPCKQCNRKFSRLKHLRYHIHSHKKNHRSLRCNKCDKLFLTIAAHCWHTCLPSKTRSKRTSDKNSDIRKKRNDMCLCIYCNKYLTRKSDLQRHLRTHTGVKLFSCKICHKKFSYKSALKRHSFLHSEKFKCNTCDKQFTRENQLKYHIDKCRIKSENDANLTPVTCSLCAKEFKFKSYLKAHMKVHIGKADFKCDICQKAFIKKASLNRHYLSHTGIKEFKCDQCDAEFNSHYLLNKHKNFHEENSEEKSKLTCADCGKYFLFPSVLQRHKLVHNPDKIKQRKRRKPKLETAQDVQDFLCSYCGKKFTYKWNLKVHLKTHIGVRYSCNVCKKNYSKKESLKDHMLSHKKEKPCACPYCGKLFRKPSFYKHLLIHKGDKKFKCEICEKGFIRKDQLTQHLRVHKL